ncbi:M6 family metalloprotease domain-containing protein [Pseudonocardiaceae bacterium YIM PH 21723]|nr:M6 family metalloprotease domain-containing protein [Pseudonocardiaceae bacterium YIM PH 21723]
MQLRRSIIGVAVAAAVGLGIPALTSAAPAPVQSAEQAQPSDELPNPFEDKRRALKQEAIAEVVKGNTQVEQRGASKVAKVGTKAATQRQQQEKSARTDQYVELSREKTDNIFVVLVEFGNERDPKYPDQDTDPNTPGPARFDGPLHNQIPEPNRGTDNKTIWNKDYSQQYFQDLYFGKGESVKSWYEKQSSGRYSVDGTVTPWVKVKYNEARYGRSNGYPCAGNTCNNTWDLVRDAVNQWSADRKAEGATDEQIKQELAKYDQWDRYDYNNNGNFNEPDGYLDHFQIVHAGGDQSDGDPWQGEDAIWSHRWYAYGTDAGKTGPADNKRGGTQIGNTGLWVGDYTAQPENGGLGVFAHEYGHDLGLPDLYDTSGPSSANENGVNWWSIMSQSRVGGKNDPVGLKAADFGAWEKMQLGWLDYETVVAGQTKTLDLGPHEYNTSKAQALAVVLPDKVKTTDLGAPAAGSKFFWSGQGDNLNTTATRDIDLTGKTAAELKLKSRFDIEADYDYLYVQASTDDGKTWTALDGTVGGNAFPKDASKTPALTGSSGGKWLDTVVPLNSLAGKKAKLRFNYVTDGGVSPVGFFADELAVTADGQPVFTDGAEGDTSAWKFNGFKVTSGKETKSYDNFYLASHRTAESWDKYLQTGPYNFGRPATPNLAEHFPYQTGLLVSYWDTSQVDNNSSQHPGEGLILPVDAHPQPIYNLEGLAWRPRIAGYDAPFSKRKGDSFTLSVNGKQSYVRGQDANPLFDDTKTYWFAEQPTAGVKLPAAGVGLKVLSENGTSLKVQVLKTK